MRAPLFLQKEIEAVYLTNLNWFSPVVLQCPSGFLNVSRTHSPLPSSSSTPYQTKSVFAYLNKQRKKIHTLKKSSTSCQTVQHHLEKRWNKTFFPCKIYWLWKRKRWKWNVKKICNNCVATGNLCVNPQSWPLVYCRALWGDDVILSPRPLTSQSCLSAHLNYLKCDIFYNFKRINFFATFCIQI